MNFCYFSHKSGHLLNRLFVLTGSWLHWLAQWTGGKQHFTGWCSWTFNDIFLWESISWDSFVNVSFANSCESVRRKMLLKIQHGEKKHTYLMSGICHFLQRSFVTPHKILNFCFVLKDLEGTHNSETSLVVLGDGCSTVKHFCPDYVGLIHISLVCWYIPNKSILLHVCAKGPWGRIDKS